MQSDDETGEGAYHLYRKNTSDKEEYDEEEYDEKEYDEDAAAWSEDDMDTRHPWKRNIWDTKPTRLGGQ